jgi:hypothetical protein
MYLFFLGWGWCKCDIYAHDARDVVGLEGCILEFRGHKIMELDVSVNTLSNFRQPRHSLVALKQLLRVMESARVCTLSTSHHNEFGVVQGVSICWRLLWAKNCYRLRGLLS